MYNEAAFKTHFANGEHFLTKEFIANISQCKVVERHSQKCHMNLNSLEIIDSLHLTRAEPLWNKITIPFRVYFSQNF